MVKSAALKNFGNRNQGKIESPPAIESRRFNECDIIGDLDRDEKGNVIPISDSAGDYRDKNGKPTNERGYLIDPKTGDIVNNLNGDKMFDKADLDEKGEVPAPFNVEKHNFNPHEVRGDFDYDRNGRAIIPPKNAAGQHLDKNGAVVSSRGYRLDAQGNIIDNRGRTKIAKAHITADGDLKKMFNYNGRRFDIVDVIGQVDKDEQGNIIPQTDQEGNFVDNLGRKINSRGYLIDEFGNVIDKDGKLIFERKHLKSDEIPKIFPFTKFNIKNLLGEFD
jgi:protein-tyrosine-phosphatase